MVGSARARPLFAPPALDLTLPQLRALFVVRRRRPLTVSDLADTLGQRLAAVSALVTRLARAGLLRRSEDPNDRRRVRLELTDTPSGCWPPSTIGPPPGSRRSWDR